MNSILDILSSLHTSVADKAGMSFANSSEEDTEYLNHFCEPNNDFERSFYQYLCQCHNENSKIKKMIYDVGSFFILLPLVLFFLLRRREDYFEKEVDAVMTKDYYTMKIMPGILAEQIKSYEIVGYTKGSLSIDDIRFIRKGLGHLPFQPFFLVKCIIRIAVYSRMIKMYNPQKICVCTEYSCTSSVLTNYCEKKGIEHINIMHGEKLLNIRESFFRYSTFYVWDQHYIDLFKKLRATTTKYIVYHPVLPQIIRKAQHVVYYLQLHSNAQLKEIKKALDNLYDEYVVRPHPNYTTPEIKNLFSDSNYEDPSITSIWESLSKAKYVISVDSTVLLQAYWYGIPVVVDDISNPRLFYELEKRDYIILNKPHKLLSGIISNNAE